MVNRFGAEDGLNISPLSSWSAGVSTWDPHSPTLAAAAFHTSLHLLDWRQNEITTTIADAHKSTIRYFNLYIQVSS